MLFLRLFAPSLFPLAVWTLFQVVVGEAEVLFYFTSRSTYMIKDGCERNNQTVETKQYRARNFLLNLWWTNLSAVITPSVRELVCPRPPDFCSYWFYLPALDLPAPHRVMRLRCSSSVGGHLSCRNHDWGNERSFHTD